MNEGTNEGRKEPMKEGRNQGIIRNNIKHGNNKNDNNKNTDVELILKINTCTLYFLYIHTTQRRGPNFQFHVPPHSFRMFLGSKHLTHIGHLKFPSSKSASRQIFFKTGSLVMSSELVSV